MRKLPVMHRPQLICLLATLLAPCAFSAQAQDCTAEVKIVSIGVPLDDTKLRNRNLTTYRYRIDATTSEKQCAAVSFNIRRSYKQRDGSAFTATDPGTLRIRGGKAQDFGEFGEKRGISKIEYAAEDLSCKRC